MSTEAHKRAIGVFPNSSAAETALHDLKAANFPMERVSVITRDNSEAADLSDRTGTNQVQEGLLPGVATGGALGGLAGLLAGLGMLAIPGVGSVIVGGAAATLAAGVGTATAVLGGLIGAYSSSGTSEQKSKIYEDWLGQGSYLVMVDGTEAEITQAESVLTRGGIQDWNIFHHPQAQPQGR